MPRRTSPSKHKDGVKKYKYEDIVPVSSYNKLMTKQTKSTKAPIKKSSFGSFNWIIVVFIALILMVGTGVFSPDTSITTSNNQDTLPDQVNVNNGAIKITAVLYSSPTCGCCHNYVDIMNNNGFDIFQKRTEAYLDIKNENNIPEHVRSCHTVIIGDYFVEGHIPKSVIMDLLSQKPDIDGIALAGMPTGSVGMGGEKTETWNIYSVLNGEVIDIFQSI